MTSDSAVSSRAMTPVVLSADDIAQQRKSYFVDDLKDELKQQQAEASAKRFKYLIGLTDLFRHFIDARAQKDKEFAEFIRSSAIETAPKQEQAETGDRRHRKTEKQEDSELLEGATEEEDSVTVFTESPAYIEGKMRDYQVQGLNWMISLYENNISGILADEMGLGKTLQTVAFLGYLRYFQGITGPHLVLVPKSTLDNWRREFAKWTPEVSTLVIQGDKETRGDLIQNRLLKCDFDVCITSYEMVLREKTQFRKFAWQYTIIDEAHRIKNEESQLSQIIRMFSTRNRLLVTGTPLQNNLHELWALLNYILPDVFSDSGTFDEWFEGQGGDQDLVVQQLHKVLRPFLLRRVKADVEHSLLPKKEVNLYVGMSPMQRQWYRKILERDIAAINGSVNKGEKSRLLNIVMQLRKASNHPYLFDGAEPGPPYTNDEHLVFNSGKMLVLDKLLDRCKENGSRVLIFSQMSRVLDLLEDYCYLRGHKYCRIDGSTKHENRIEAIDDYNRPGSDKFIFLLTTRAGGLGINLVTADTVVLFDSDWNPQADLQAMDRAHRIGQTKQVYVYRFVTENSVEEKVVERAAKKLRLDQLVIQQGRAQKQKESANSSSKEELINMIQHGAQDVMDKTNSTITKNSFDIEELLSKGEERTAQLNSRYEKLGLDDLNKFDGNTGASYEWDGKNFKNKKKFAPTTISIGKRERRENYSIEKYYKGVLKKDDREKQPRAPKPPKLVNLQDHQFWPQRLYDLQDKETAWFRKQVGYKAPLSDGSKVDKEERELDQQLEQWEIDHAEPLTEEEIQEKRELGRRGYSNWSRREFTSFVNLMATLGRDNLAEIAANLPEKQMREVEVYHEAFWRRLTEIELFERYKALVEAGQEKTERLRTQSELIKRKVESCDAPLQQLTFDMPSSNSGRRTYSDEEDRFLVYSLYNFGLDAPNLYEQIREAIRESPLFRFDWFFLSRTPQELSRRCQTLLGAITREYDDKSKKAKLE